MMNSKLWLLGISSCTEPHPELMTNALPTRRFREALVGDGVGSERDELEAGVVELK